MITNIPGITSNIWILATLSATLLALICLAFGIIAVKNYRKQENWRKK